METERSEHYKHYIDLFFSEKFLKKYFHEKR